jgi:hypothetical protein
MATDQTSKALLETLMSPNESDRNLEAALSDDDVPANQRDLMGAIVDGAYWVFLEDTLRADANTLKRRPDADTLKGPQAILDRLVATVNDVPAQLIKEQQEPWNDVNKDNDWLALRWPHDEMIEEIVRGEYAPESATLFVMEYIRRLTGARAS